MPLFLSKAKSSTWSRIFNASYLLRFFLASWIISKFLYWTGCHAPAVQNICNMTILGLYIWFSHCIELFFPPCVLGLIWLVRCSNLFWYIFNLLYCRVPAARFHHRLCPPDFCVLLYLPRPPAEISILSERWCVLPTHDINRMIGASCMFLQSVNSWVFEFDKHFISSLLSYEFISIK